MRPIKSGPLTNLEIEELDAFLLSDDGLENAMDVSSLDGFLCSTVGAKCHHAVEVDTVGLGFYGSQPVPGVYEREASATHP